MSCRRMNQHSLQKRDFRCEECGAIAPAIKQRCKTNPGHVKDMWCHICRRETRHVQVDKWKEAT